MRRLMAPANAALAVLGVLTLVLLVLAIHKQESLTASARPAPISAPGPAPAAPAPAVSPPSVAFLADGWTSGAPPGGEGPANYTALLAAREGWRVTNPSVYGSGYVAGGTLEAQVPEAVAAQPQLVVVSGGRADDVSDPAAVRDAASRLYRDLRARLPQASVVVIGPMWLGDDPPPRMLDVRDAIREAATEAKLPFVDPIADRWFNGRDEDGITADGDDLNDRGHQRLVELVDDAVRRAGASPQ